MADDEDFVTQEDIAAGFEAFSAGWHVGRQHEANELHAEVQDVLKRSDAAGLLIACFSYFGYDWFADPEWKAPAAEDYWPADEEPFAAWRQVHPRDKNSLPAYP